MQRDEEGKAENICINCLIVLKETSDVYIYCVDCSKDKDNVYVCLACFCMGAECGPHKRGHNYQIRDGCGSEMFTGETDDSFQGYWGWKEDKKLLAASHKLKLGNWDEIAKHIPNKTGEQTRIHFDRYFIRGLLGLYASSNLHWPFIDDMTADEFDDWERAPCFSGKRRFGSGPSRWQYIADFVAKWDEEIDLDNPIWFEEFEKQLAIFKKSYVPPLAEKYEDFHDSKSSKSDSLLWNKQLDTPQLSPVTIQDEENKIGKRKYKRIFFPDEEEKSIDVKQESESGESSEVNVRFMRSSVQSKTGRGMRSLHIDTTLRSSTEELDGQSKTSSSNLTNDNLQKPVAKISRRGRAPAIKKKVAFKETLKTDKLELKISDKDKEKLRDTYPEQYYIHRPSLPLGTEQLEKLEKDDLQLLAYMPERDDFEWEYNNNAERLISRIHLETNNDEDTSFENEIKLIKLHKYNRVIKQRMSKKAVIREFEMVNQFFEKMKKTNEKRSSLIYNRKYYELVRRQQNILSLMDKAHQVIKSKELTSLIDITTNFKDLTEKISELQEMQESGVKVLKGSQKVSLKAFKGKRKRKCLRGIKTNKKTLRWKRYKRWSMRQNTSIEGGTESDSMIR